MNPLNETQRNNIKTGLRDLVCFSHLRWNFVYQRPQHLLSRFSNHFRVFLVEEPIFDAASDHLEIYQGQDNVWIVVPHLEKGRSDKNGILSQKRLLSELFQQKVIKDYFFWYYTPMALPISDHFEPQLIVYDCMDELSSFKFAPAELTYLEDELFVKADIVFTGGHSLYEAKKHRHYNIYPFPSSIDKEHFVKARFINNDPGDQETIPRPRIGYFGVIDERMDLDLVSKVAEYRPEWQFVMVGPVLKINPDTLPKPGNIHYLGSKTYRELPAYLSGWDIAMIPFALNESTKFISPTKTPEYLAAGKPVISTSIQDVVSPYGENGLVHIANTPEEFIRMAELELKTTDRSNWLKNVDAFLSEDSWDKTWNRMMHLITDKWANRNNIPLTNLNSQEYV